VNCLWRVSNAYEELVVCGVLLNMVRMLMNKVVADLPLITINYLRKGATPQKKIADVTYIQ